MSPWSKLSLAFLAALAFPGTAVAGWSAPIPMDVGGYLVPQSAPDGSIVMLERNWDYTQQPAEGQRSRLAIKQPGALTLTREDLPARTGGLRVLGDGAMLLMRVGDGGQEAAWRIRGADGSLGPEIPADEDFIDFEMRFGDDPLIASEGGAVALGARFEDGWRLRVRRPGSLTVETLPPLPGAASCVQYASADVTDAGGAIVAWRDTCSPAYEGEVRTSTYAPGSGWSAPQALGEISGSPRVAVTEDGSAVIVWRATSGTIRLARRGPDDAAFGASTAIEGGTNGEVGAPRVWSGGRFAVAVRPGGALWRRTVYGLTMVTSSAATAPISVETVRPVPGSGEDEPNMQDPQINARGDVLATAAFGSPSFAWGAIATAEAGASFTQIYDDTFAGRSRAWLSDAGDLLRIARVRGSGLTMRLGPVEAPATPPRALACGVSDAWGAVGGGTALVAYRRWDGGDVVAVGGAGAPVTTRRLPLLPRYSSGYRPFVSPNGKDAVLVPATILQDSVGVILKTEGASAGDRPAEDTSACDGSFPSRPVTFDDMGPESVSGERTGNLSLRLGTTRSVNGILVVTAGRFPIVVRSLNVPTGEIGAWLTLRLPAAQRARVLAGTANLKLVLYDRYGRVLGKASYGG